MNLNEQLEFLRSRGLLASIVDGMILIEAPAKHGPKVLALRARIERSVRRG